MCMYITYKCVYMIKQLPVYNNWWKETEYVITQPLRRDLDATQGQFLTGLNLEHFFLLDRLL